MTTEQLEFWFIYLAGLQKEIHAIQHLRDIVRKSEYLELSTDGKITLGILIMGYIIK